MSKKLLGPLELLDGIIFWKSVTSVIDDSIFVFLIVMALYYMYIVIYLSAAEVTVVVLFASDRSPSTAAFIKTHFSFGTINF